MLHIVQIVLSGMAEMPQVFSDQAVAESAYVECVKKCWKQSYSAYCECHGARMDSFASAKAFLDTLDLSERYKINYWVVNPEEVGLEMMKNLEGIKQRQERIGNSVRQVEQRSVAVREELTGLLDDIAQLVDNLDNIDAPPAEVRAVAGPTGDRFSPAMAQQDEPEEPAEIYTTREWKAFVGTVMNRCGGNRSEFPLLSRSDWRQDVYSNLTSFEYWDWVASKISQYKKKAQKAEYTVLEDPESPGHYKYRAPEGTAGETSFHSEWEAWCDAGMHLPPEPAVAHR